MRLLYTGSGVERWVEDADAKLEAFRADSGYWYLRHQGSTPPDNLVVEDLGVTLLMNSQITWRNAKSVIDHGDEIELGSLPSRPLEQTTAQDRQEVAELIAAVAKWPGFGASTATKLIHKKRPALIPILDNLAIFGAYLNPAWGPSHPAPNATVKDVRLIRAALDRIFVDLTHPENENAFRLLSGIEPGHSRIQIFDTVWWIHFRRIEPVRRR